MIETQESDVADLEVKIGQCRPRQAEIKNEMFSIREQILDKENELAKLERKVKREEVNLLEVGNRIEITYCSYRKYYFSRTTTLSENKKKNCKKQ